MDHQELGIDFLFSFQVARSVCLFTVLIMCDNDGPVLFYALVEICLNSEDFDNVFKGMY
jgi:hypothetical protein